MNGRNELHTPLKLGISSCLLGDRVRWDGDHERRSFLADVLAPHVTFVRVCPELEIGLGVPREPIALVRDGAGHALVGATSRRDLTAAMSAFAAARADGFEGLDGYVLKSRSPSCGLAGARVYADRATLFADGPFERSGRGLFAKTLVRRRPLLPVVEELQLETLGGQLHFAERCFAMRRARRLRAAIAASAATDATGGTPAAAGATAGTLATFLEEHELQLLCRSAKTPRALARATAAAPDDADGFFASFAAAMAEPPVEGRLPGVLRRAANRLRSRPAAAARAEDAIAAFEAGRRSFPEACADLRGAIGPDGDELLRRQTLLFPEPEETAMLQAIANGFRSSQ